LETNSSKFSFQFKKVENNKESKSVLYSFKKSIDILEKKINFGIFGNDYFLQGNEVFKQAAQHQKIMVFKHILRAT
jgi:hypothetical protein